MGAPGQARPVWEGEGAMRAYLRELAAAEGRVRGAGVHGADALLGFDATGAGAGEVHVSETTLSSERRA